jgi:glycosyltransferase involved in cell wall biosynthesis
MALAPRQRRTSRREGGSMDDRDIGPIALHEVELSAPIRDVPPAGEATRPYRRAHVLVRLHTRPIGVVDMEIDGNGVSAQELTTAIWEVFAARINEHLKADDLGEIDGIDAHGVPTDGVPVCLHDRKALLSNAPMASVIICTRNRPATLQRTLESLEHLEYPSFEVIVVDGSGDSATRELVSSQFPDFVYFHVGNYGKSIAANTGVELASGAIAAFTDDDAVVDRHWLIELVAALDGDERLACATGLAMPLELETPAQIWFEESGGFTQGYDRRVLDLNEPRERGSLLPYATGRIGAGVNMAWKRPIIREIGFDVALDGLAAFDLASFYDALVRGYKIVYEPGAIVYHEHRRTYAELRHQLYRHGLGLGIYLTRCLVTQPRRIPDFLRVVPRGAYYGFSPSSWRNRGKAEDFPAALTWAEVVGTVAGPFAYLKNLGKTKLRRIPKSVVGSASSGGSGLASGEEPRANGKCS